MSDAELVAHARECFADGEAGLKTAKLCVALLFERRRRLCGRSAPRRRRPTSSTTSRRGVRALRAGVYLRRNRSSPSGPARPHGPQGHRNLPRTPRPIGAPSTNSPGRLRRRGLRRGRRVESSAAPPRWTDRSARSSGGGCGRALRRRDRGATGQARGNVDVIFFRALTRCASVGAMNAERAFDASPRLGAGRQPDPAAAIAAAPRGRAPAARGHDRRLSGGHPRVDVQEEVVRRARPT